MLSSPRKSQELCLFFFKDCDIIDKNHKFNLSSAGLSDDIQLSFIKLYPVVYEMFCWQTDEQTWV